jgi:carbamoyl-phosphate synthase large subunit
VLILRAGSGPSNSLIRSLQAASPRPALVGCHDDRFVLNKSLAGRNYLVPASTERNFPRELARIVREARVDVLIPTTDDDVLRISRLRSQLPCRTFLPRHSVIERCQDKYALARFLRRRGIPAPLTCALRSLGEIEAVFRRLAPRSPLWCRVRKGSGSFGAIPVTRPEQARSWIRYFQEVRGVPPGAFTLSEYLPGRDFCVQSLWRDGRLILVKMAERLTYIDNGGPSGVSSMAALARTAFDAIVIEACMRAVRALDARASGAFFADVKESADGAPCITEINAGRLASMTNLLDLSGRSNMSATYVRLALGEPVRIRDPLERSEDCYIVRSVDTAPAVFRARELFRGIDDGSR